MLLTIAQDLLHQRAKKDASKKNLLARFSGLSLDDTSSQPPAMPLTPLQQVLNICNERSAIYKTLVDFLNDDHIPLAQKVQAIREFSGHESFNASCKNILKEGYTLSEVVNAHKLTYSYHGFSTIKLFIDEALTKHSEGEAKYFHLAAFLFDSLLYEKTAKEYIERKIQKSPDRSQQFNIQSKQLELINDDITILESMLDILKPYLGKIWLSYHNTAQTRIFEKAGRKRSYLWNMNYIKEHIEKLSKELNTAIKKSSVIQDKTLDILGTKATTTTKRLARLIRSINFPPSDIFRAQHLACFNIDKFYEYSIIEVQVNDLLSQISKRIVLLEKTNEQRRKQQLKNKQQTQENSSKPISELSESHGQQSAPCMEDLSTRSASKLFGEPGKPTEEVDKPLSTDPVPTYLPQSQSLKPVTTTADEPAPSKIDAIKERLSHARIKAVYLSVFVSPTPHEKIRCSDLEKIIQLCGGEITSSGKSGGSRRRIKLHHANVWATMLEKESVPSMTTFGGYHEPHQAKAKSWTVRSVRDALIRAEYHPQKLFPKSTRKEHKQRNALAAGG